MSTNTASSPVDFLSENHLLSALASLALLVAGIATVSVPLLLSAGVVAYGWPFLYVYLLNLKDKSNAAEKAPAKRLHSIRPSAVGAR